MVFYTTYSAAAQNERSQQAHFFKDVDSDYIVVISVSEFKLSDTGNTLQKIFDCIEKQYEASTETQVYRHPTFVIRLLPFYRSKSFADRFIKKLQENGQTFRRYEDAEVYFLNFEVKPTLFRIKSMSGTTIDECTPKTIKSFRQLELISLLKLTNCEFVAPEDHVFRLPSGELNEVFLRIGNIQRSSENLHILYFWLRRIVSEFTHILGDTWTISTILFFIQSREMELFKRKVAIGFIGSYFSADQAKLRGIADFLIANKFSQADKLLLFWSVAKSGRSIRRMADLLQSKHPALSNSTENLVFANLNPGAELSISDFVVRNYESAGQNIQPELLEGSKLVIDVDPIGYYPTISNYKLKPFLVKQYSKDSEDKTFFETYGGHGIFSVHKNGRHPDSGAHAHHAFHINFELLSNHNAYLTKLQNAVSKLPDNQFDLVVAIEKPSTRRLASLIADNIRYEKIVFVPYPAIKGNNHIRDEFLEVGRKVSGRKPRILVLESVIITGDRTSSIVRQWRESDLVCDIVFFVGLLRSDSVDTAKHLMKRIGWNQVKGSVCSLTVVDSVVLPKWGRNECPWCRETKHLQHILKERKSEHESYIVHFEQRLQILVEGEAEGIAKSVLHNRDPGAEDSEFGSTSGSLFFDKANLSGGADCQAADWQLAVASAIQKWRTDNTQNSNIYIDANPIVGSHDFNDPLLRATIFRSLLPEEVLKIHGPDRKRVVDYITDKSRFKNESHSHFCLGAEAVLCFGKLLQNIDTTDVLDPIASTLLSSVLSRGLS
jgi:hypothetical protein